VIPRIIHRTLPASPRPDVEALWQTVIDNTEGWERRTYQSPRNPADWPITGGLFQACPDRAMESNLVRFEALWEHGGVYVDSDVSLVRPLTPLLDYGFFAGWESSEWVGSAVIGARPKHPAIRVLLDAMAAHVAGQRDRSSCPRVITPLLTDRSDVTLLPIRAFYAVPFERRTETFDFTDDAEVFGVHHWHASWL